MQAHWSRWGRCAAVGDLGPVRASARHRHRARRRHVRRHRRWPSDRGRRSSAARSSPSHRPARRTRAAWVERMKFWTAMHEIGHAFNLAHSWQKWLGTAWVPLANEPSALRTMNYRTDCRRRASLAFFAAFDYSFSRTKGCSSACDRTGSCGWVRNRGSATTGSSRRPSTSSAPPRPDPWSWRCGCTGSTRFEFLEPVVAELRLKNVSSTPMVVDANALRGDGLAIVVSKDGGETKRWLPFARYCMAPAPQVLQPGDAIYESVFLSAGTGGWLVSEPGTYTVYARHGVRGGCRCAEQAAEDRRGASDRRPMRSAWPMTCSPRRWRTRWPSVARAC